MKLITALAIPCLLAAAEWPKDAEQRFQMKYGRPSPVAEQSEARKQAAKQKTKPTFEALDTNRDGKIDRDEWDQYQKSQKTEGFGSSGVSN